MNYSELTKQAGAAVDILLGSAKPNKGDIFLVGC